LCAILVRKIRLYKSNPAFGVCISPARGDQLLWHTGF
jgi:hypothetical protein